MKLPFYDFNTMGTREVDYPTELFSGLIKFLVNSNAWRDDVRLVEDKVKRLKTDMETWRMEHEHMQHLMLERERVEREAAEDEMAELAERLDGAFDEELRKVTSEAE